MRTDATTGELRLGVELRGGRAVLADQFHRGALKVLRPRALGAGLAGVTVVNPGGGFLAGDRYRTDVTVGPGAGLDLTSQSATKVYRSPGPTTRQVIHLTAGPGALLDHRPEPLVLYHDADFAQELVVRAAPDASVIVEDILTAGWSPDGRTHPWRSYRNRTVLEIAGRRWLTDVLVLTGADDPTTAALRRPPAAFRTPLGAEGRTPSHLGTLLLTGPAAVGSLAQLQELVATCADLRGAAGRIAAPPASGDTGPDAGAVLVRAVAAGTEPLQEVFASCADLVRTTAGRAPREHHQW